MTNCKLQVLMLLASVMMVVIPGTQAVPEVINYQGRIEVDSVPFSGTGQFRFAILDEASVYLWSNDGSYPPVSSETVPVVDGLYSVILGDLATMISIAPSIFDTHDELYLRIWFDDGVYGSQLLVPDQRLTSVGYAHKADLARNADTLDGIDSSQILRNDQDGTLNGSLTVTGTMVSSAIRMTSGPSSGYVLTSDASGNGTWQPAPTGTSGGGGFEYPDGTSNITPVILDNLLSTPYSVPVGKTFYITNAYAGNNGTLYINGAIVLIGYFNTGSVGDCFNHLAQPLLAAGGDPVSANDNTLVINGFLVNTGVTPVTRNGLLNTHYFVPADKILVITNVYASNSYFYLGGKIILRGYFTTGQVGGRMQHLSTPILVPPGTEISAEANENTFNGYLRNM